ncbi:hypothetical protein NQ317_018571 [Molorchus minor]|uniref:Poly [ADP-ribose] polymerase n=1 Tax=Molorchus minor TaxID=1323400 RepID=A0ABQ9JWH3_9CUCU|nr:hypothetical protein NQ317_018571 [Molorchus minor]
MGNLLSNNNKSNTAGSKSNLGYRFQQESASIYNFNEDLLRVQRLQRLHQLQEIEIKRKREVEELRCALERLTIQEQKHQPLVSVEKRPQAQAQRRSIKTIIVNQSMINDFLQSTSCDLTLGNIVQPVYQLVSLTENSWEFNTVKRLFTSTNKRCFQVREIRKIINPYLLLQYQLTKERYKNKYGYLNEKTLFHGTNKSNIDEICKFNFNWRLNGKARGHKFGKGVSFSPIANYATHYGDKTYNKVMIVANVLVNSHHVGNQFTEVPLGNCDATSNTTEQVFCQV